MTRHLLTTAEFGAAVREGQQPEAMVIGFGETKAAPDSADGATAADFVYSDGGIDHQNDTINVQGWDTSVFARNPTALWAHDATSPPVGKSSTPVVRNGKLVGRITFTPPSTYGFGAMIGRLVKGGFLNAVSVGFKPTKFEMARERDRPLGLNFLQQQLLEISVVPLPANPRALVEARAAGIDTRMLKTWAERVLDGEGEAGGMTRGALEAIHDQARDGVAARVSYARGVKARMAAALEPPKPPATPAERLQYVADLRRDLAAREERTAHVADLRRRLGI